MLQTQELRTVLATYSSEFQPDHLEDLGAAGGFSGARFWRLHTPHGTLCLRRWPPEHPQADRLEYIHAVLAHVARGGVKTVPVPMENGPGKTYVPAGGCLWELAPWMPGEADYRRVPNRIKLGAAMRALAEFHQAAAGFAPAHISTTIAPAVVERQNLLNDLSQYGYQQIASAVGSGPRNRDAIFVATADRILTLFPQVGAQVRSQLAAAAQLSVPTHPVIRDVWHDHILFSGEAVTGLIDFGAMRNDNVAVDVSRLLGSLVGDDKEGWEHGLGAYQQIRPLSRDEYELIGTLDSSTILLSGLNWLRWIYLEGRLFDDMSQVAGRLREIAGRLENLAARSGRSIVRGTGQVNVSCRKM